MEPPADPTTDRLVPIVSWALYDFAATIFSYVVISRYFNEWMINRRHVPDWNVGAMSFCVAIPLVLTLAPVGAVADRIGRRKPFLVGFTLACAALTSVIGFTHSTLATLVVAGAAIFFWQSGFAQNDPLLARVASPQHAGRVSGLGTGFGYVGVIVCLIVIEGLVGIHPIWHVFVVTALLYLAFALPCFAFVPDTVPTGTGISTGAAITAAREQLHATRRVLFGGGEITRFLLGRFLYADALTTVVAYMVVYMDRLGGFSGASKNLILALAIFCAAISAFVAGWIVERVGPRQVLLTALSVGIAAIVVESASGSRALVWVLGPAIGIALGGTWSSDRVLMLRLSPADARGEFFGVYNLVGKLSAGVGPLVLWGGTVLALHGGLGWALLPASRVALGVLGAAMVAGALLITTLPRVSLAADAPHLAPSPETGHAVA